MKMMTKNQKGKQTGFLLKLSKQSNIYVISEFSYSVEKKKISKWAYLLSTAEPKYSIRKYVKKSNLSLGHSDIPVSVIHSNASQKSNLALKYDRIPLKSIHQNCDTSSYSLNL